MCNYINRFNQKKRDLTSKSERKISFGTFEQIFNITYFSQDLLLAQVSLESEVIFWGKKKSIYQKSTKGGIKQK